MAIITALSTSERKGMRKINTDTVELIKDFGIKDDAHGGQWHRQVSFLAQESIDFMREKGLDVVAGNFAENITTTGIDLPALSVGTHIKIGATEMIISQLGKICHNRCAIYHQAGDCVMPREGIFGVVIKGGCIKVGDEIEILDSLSESAAIVTENAIAQDIAYDELKKIDSAWKTSFTRIDTLNTQKNNLKAIFKDLQQTQKTQHIFFYDPEKTNKFLFDQEEKQENVYYCTNLKEIVNISKH